MVKLINKTTGTEMWVADNRVTEYTAAGHKPAASGAKKPAEKKPDKENAAKKPEEKK